MSRSKRTAKILSGFFATIVGAASIAQADTISGITSLTGNDTALWNTIAAGDNTPIPNGSSVTTTSVTTPNTVSVAFSAAPSWPGYLALKPGVLWSGGSNSFPNGTYLLDTNNPQGVSDSITLSFTTPVSAVAFGIQVWSGADNFTATVSTASGGGKTFSQTGTGAPITIGLSDATGANISSVVISLVDTTNSGDNGFFAIGPLTLQEGSLPNGGGGGPAPEPGSLALMATGGAALLWKLRRRART